ncbi:hypothetical protein N339_08071, partial [Pterocles gutturalis]
QKSILIRYRLRFASLFSYLCKKLLHTVSFYTHNLVFPLEKGRPLPRD